MHNDPLYGLTVTVPPVAEPVTLHEMRLQLRVCDGTEIQLDRGGVATDLTGGVSGLPAAGHGLSQSGGDRIIASGTDAYDGTYYTTAATTANVVAIIKTFTAETFDGDEYIHNGGAEDEKIYALTIAARKMAEQIQDRAYITQTIELFYDRFYPNIRPPKAPLMAVSSIKYFDNAGDEQTLSTDIYTVDAKRDPARIVRAFNQQWPVTRRIPNAVTVTYTAGYGATRASTPETAKQAIMLLVGHWYENREEVTFGSQPHELPLGVQALLILDRVF